ncbi:unnamed protein product [Urochloa humidicola]
MGETSASFSSLVREAVGLPYGVSVEEASLASLPRQWLDFKRSRPPKKFVLIGHEEKGERPIETSVREDFATGRPVAEVAIPNPPGSRVLYDFLRKVVLVLDAEGAIEKTMAFYWVDDDGWIFLPVLWGDADEAKIRKALEGRLAVTAVRRCRHREARAVGFLDKMRGRTAWAFGWYGAAARDVQAAADGGDLAVNWALLGDVRAHGRGVHLSVQGDPMLSAELSLAAMNNQQTAHILFCALAPGFPEIIPAGSPQFKPSGALFCSGADNTKNPTWYVFWESSAGTRVLPLYMISFRPTQRYKRTGSPPPHDKGSSHKKVRFAV